MSVALYFVTHKGIASHLYRIADAILQLPAENLAFIEIPMGADIKICTDKAIRAIEKLNKQSGLIIITDLYGSTPGNIAQTLSDKFPSNFISGINLPMLVRLLNYRDEPLDSLTAKAISGGRNGIQQH